MTRAHTFPNVFSGQGCVTPLSPQEPRIREVMPSTFCRTPLDSESQGSNEEDSIRGNPGYLVAEQLPEGDHAAQAPDQGIEVVNAPESQPTARQLHLLRYEAQIRAQAGLEGDVYLLNPSQMETEEVKNIINRILPTGISLAWSYHTGKNLGNGSFGKVRHCYLRGKPAAVKRMVMHQKDVAKKEVGTDTAEMEMKAALMEAFHIACEISFMNSFHHANIVALRGVSRHHGNVYMALEFMDAGDAGKIGTGQGLNHIPECLLAVLTREVAQGIAYIHSMGCTHCNIKPQNILLSTDGRIKICDFGICGSHLSNPSYTVKGTPPYMALEVIKGRSVPQSDVWALGIATIFWETGYLPFRGTPRDIYYRIRSVAAEFENLVIPKGISLEFQEFLKLALVLEATQRASAASLLEIPFLKNAPPASSLIQRIFAKKMLSYSHS